MTFDKEHNVNQTSLVDDHVVNVVVRSQDSGFDWMNLVWILIAVVFIVVMYRASKKAGQTDGLAKMGKHKAKRGDLISRKTFADVAGVGQAKEDLVEVVDFLKNPAKYRRLGARMPRGTLLIGPPGTGKTLLAEATAGEAGVPFFAVSGADFQEMLVGVGSTRVASLFEEARRHAPSIIFIDEVDVLGAAREGTNTSDENKQTLNQLLTAMQGLGDMNAEVIVLAATNRQEVMDPALLRPGRFDRRINVPRPDVNGREAILKVHAKKFVLDPAVDLHDIAVRTPGMAGAHLHAALNEAALLAAKRGDDFVRYADVIEGIDKVRMGGPSGLVMSAEERLNTARHEAGHAIVAMCLETVEPVRKVTILPRGSALGLTIMNPDTEQYQETERCYREHLAMALGGRAAELMYYAMSGTTSGASGDLKTATDAAVAMVTRFGLSDVGLRVIDKTSLGTYGCSSALAERIDLEVESIMQEALRVASNILEQKRALVDRMVGDLLEKETLGGDELDKYRDACRAVQ